MPRSHTNAVLGDGRAAMNGRKRGLVELVGMEEDYLYQAKKYKSEASKNAQSSSEAGLEDQFRRAQ